MSSAVAIHFGETAYIMYAVSPLKCSFYIGILFSVHFVIDQLIRLLVLHEQLMFCVMPVLK